MAKKILIVDDDRQIASLLASRLRANEYEVVMAYDAVQAVANAISEKPDLILLDIRMPAGGGLSAMDNFRKSAKTSVIPVIVITAYPSPKIRQKVKDMGAVDFIAKPFEAEDMLSRIEKALTEGSPRKGGSGSMTKKILVVDDESDTVELLQARLEKNGYGVIVAYDGQEALDKTYQENPDLIILDIMLPKVDGYNVCKTLRSDEKYKAIPIVMLTARTLTQDIKMGMDLGAVSYVQKPFKPEVLLGIIQGLLKA
ncbi:MAG: response regulator [Candidatus Aminicenantales bacterium]